MSKKNRNDNEKNMWMAIIAIGTIAIISLLILIATSTSKTDKELNKEGYTTTSEDAFYKKIVTNNTLDSYYNDVANNQDSSYEEYYLQKDSLNFLELKMTNYNSVNTTLSISSNIRTNLIEYNFEMSYRDSHLILEGNSTEDYDCHIVLRKNVKDSEAKNQCDYIMREISTFEDRRDEILQNEKVQEILSQPIQEYVEE